MSYVRLTGHMTHNAGQDQIAATHLGQAHVAGTGPQGATCRQCNHWYSVRNDKPFHPYRRGDDGLMHLEPARCRYPIAGKARRRVSAEALACRLFEKSDLDLPLTRAPKRAPS